MQVQLMERPRLIETLSHRWLTRVTVIAAGPGFGKSVLLEQMVAENRLAPRGVDVLVRCVAADADPDRFLASLSAAADVGKASDDGSPSIESLTSGLAGRSPDSVCICVDDIDVVTEHEVGRRLLAALVNQAPPSVHFVFAGRRGVPGVARMRLAGEVVDVGEDDLVMSNEETQQFAELQGVDPSVVRSVGGWPAAAALAVATGSSGVREYLTETVLDHLCPAGRRSLAIAAALGGGDVGMLSVATGRYSTTLAELLSGLPLVGERQDGGGRLDVHDVWTGVVADELAAEELAGAVALAAEWLVDHDEFDRAFRIRVADDDWSGAAAVLTSCCRRGHLEIVPEVLSGWLDLLPDARRDEPEGLLLRGLLGRVSDAFAPHTADLLERAVLAYRAAGNVAGEVAAGVELVYVLRNQGRCDAMATFLARVVELDEAGHVEAAGPAAVGRALIAELSGDDRSMLARFDAIPAGSLSRDWQQVVAFRQTMGHLTLGRSDEMVEAAVRCASLAGGSNDRHVLPLAQWFAGDPRPALRDYTEIAGDVSRSRVDAVLLGTFACTVMASIGRIDDAAARLTCVEKAASGPIGPLMAGALVGVRALLQVARGDEIAATHLLMDALDDDPLSGPIGWRKAARWLPLAYVLIPATREYLDAVDTGPVHRRRLSVARALVAVRDGRAVSPNLLRELTPDLVATAVPLPWAMELATVLAAHGASQGRDIAENLFDLFGEPARTAMRLEATCTVKRRSVGARKLLSTIAMAPPHLVRLDVLGQLVLHVGDEEAVHPHWQRERVRSLLLYLVLHGPAHREELIDALWPHLDLAAADRNLRVTLTYLNQVLDPGRHRGEMSYFVRQSGSIISLVDSPRLEFAHAEFASLVDDGEDADSRGLPTIALGRFDEGLRLWRGPCLSGLSYEDWAQTWSRHLTSRYVHAAVRSAEIHLAAGRAGAAERSARKALAVDEWSEVAHRALIRTELARCDRRSAIAAMTDCDNMLAELGVTADTETQELRRHLFAVPVQAG